MVSEKVERNKEKFEIKNKIENKIYSKGKNVYE
jgi:hypothetical protein